MNVLGFDTSTNATSVALLRADGEAFATDPDPSRLLGRPGHAAELMPAVKQVMDEAETGWDDIGAIAVGVGPGTFTGLRIGIATARALAHARAIPVHPVRSLDALASGLDDSRPRLALIDARRGELFAALRTTNGTTDWEPFVDEPEAIAERIRKHFEAQEPPQAAGDGSIRFREVLEAAGADIPPDDSPLHLVRALHICRLAGGIPPSRPETVLPLYLREPDAKPQIPQ